MPDDTKMTLSISLRDWRAMFVMAGMLSSQAAIDLNCDSPDACTLAEIAYLYADALDVASKGNP